ncbi:MAG: NAD(+) synthase, partial [Selenomonadales bacterium]|nr:NAD(+) synthase [Selenomonadales bacterium]
MLKLALGQFEIIPGRPDLNTKTMLDMIQEAKEAHVDMLIFPALSISGQLLSDTWKQSDFVRD